MIGSPGFMSPEQAMGYEVGPPSDIFSLGAVLAFAATGEGPFGAGTTAALLYRVVHGSPGLDRVPTEVRPLIERCLAKDPSQRPTAAACSPRSGPSSRRRTGCPNRSSARSPGIPRQVPRLPRPAWGSGQPAIAFGEAAPQTRAANSAAQVPSGESLLLAPAGTSQAATSGNMPLPPGGTHPPGATYGQPRQAGKTGRAPLVAAAGAGVARRLPGRGSCSRCRRDRFRRAHAHPGSVPGGTDFLSGGIHVRRTGCPCRVCLLIWLLVCLPEPVLVSERSIPPRAHLSRRVRLHPLPRRMHPTRLLRPRPRPQPIPVRLPVPVPVYTRLPVHIAIDEHIIVGARGFVRASIHVGEHTLVRIGIRFYVAA